MGRRTRVQAIFAAVALTLVAGCGGGAEETATSPPGAGANGTSPDNQDADGASPTAGGTPQDREPVSISLVTAFPQDDVLHEGFWLYVEELEKAAPWIEIDYRGGPDAIPPTQQAEAVADGAVDMSTLPESYYLQNAPLLYALKFTPFTPSEERENGVYEIVADYHEQQLGVHYLGRVTENVPFQMYVNEQLDGPDFSGLTFRVSPTYVPLVEALGGEPVSIPGGETYTALERGTVDGLGWTSIGMIDNGFSEVVQYEIMPDFYEDFQTVIIDLDTWEGLDQETQEIMTDVMIETEPKIADLYAEMVANEREQRRADGMEVIEFTGEDAETYLDAAYEAGWDHALSEDPDAQELRDIFGN